MDTKKLKPFDLEAAKRGEPMVTRNGRKATFVAHVAECYEQYRLIVLVEGNSSCIHCFENGLFSRNDDSNDDLFMAPRKVTRWVNIRAGDCAAFHYDTPERAREEQRRSGLSASEYLAIAVPVEIEV